MAKGWAITKPSFLKSKGGNSSGPLLKLLLSLLMAASTLFTVNEISLSLLLQTFIGNLFFIKQIKRRWRQWCAYVQNCVVSSAAGVGESVVDERQWTSVAPCSLCAAARRFLRSSERRQQGTPHDAFHRSRKCYSALSIQCLQHSEGLCMTVSTVAEIDKS